MQLLYLKGFSNGMISVMKYGPVSVRNQTIIPKIVRRLVSLSDTSPVQRIKLSTVPTMRHQYYILKRLVSLVEFEINSLLGYHRVRLNPAYHIA